MLTASRAVAVDVQGGVGEVDLLDPTRRLVPRCVHPPSVGTAERLHGEVRAEAAVDGRRQVAVRQVDVLHRGERRVAAGAVEVGRSQEHVDDTGVDGGPCVFERRADDEVGEVITVQVAGRERRTERVAELRVTGRAVVLGDREACGHETAARAGEDRHTTASNALAMVTPGAPTARSSMPSPLKSPTGKRAAEVGEAGLERRHVGARRGEELRRRCAQGVHAGGAAVKDRHGAGSCCRADRLLRTDGDVVEAVAVEVAGGNGAAPEVALRRGAGDTAGILGERRRSSAGEPAADP